MDRPLFFDSTLRDGSHAIAHKFSAAQISEYCRAADSIGFHTIIVGHGNGLGASSLQVGLAALSDTEMISAARRELKRTKLGVFLLPGFGTIKDDLCPALDQGVDLVCVASHCTEADVTLQHIRYVRSRGKEVYGVLMMHHLTTPARLVEEARKMESAGALGIIIMDSAGGSTPEMVDERIRALCAGLRIRVGFHAHDNLGLAVANSYTALRAGATIIDGTVRGFGPSAGNCRLEVMAGLLRAEGIETGLQLYNLLDVSEEIVSKFMPRPQQISSISLISGLAGVFSGFTPHVQRAAERFGVDPRDIFLELGRRKILAGQEDYIVDVAAELAEKKASDSRDPD
jgi:4-hydroxy 2-oxovalerate aldolase